MPPFFHDRRKARLPTGVGVSRRHRSITFPEVFRFRGAGVEPQVDLEKIKEILLNLASLPRPNIFSEELNQLAKAVELNQLAIADKLNQLAKAVELNQLAKAVDLAKAVELNQLAIAVELNQLAKAVDLNQLAKAVDLNQLAKAVELNQLAIAVELNQLAKAVELNQLAKAVDIIKVLKSFIRQKAPEENLYRFSEEELNQLAEAEDIIKVFISFIRQKAPEENLYRFSEEELNQLAEAEDIIKVFKSFIRQKAPEENLYRFSEEELNQLAEAEDIIKVFKSFIRQKAPEENLYRFSEELNQLAEAEDIIKVFKSFIRQKAPEEKLDEDEHAVGVEEEVENMLQESILNEEKRGLSIAAVVGMGGIGKSTLAREIYTHPNVVDRFDARAWVEVSSECTPKETIMQLILQLSISDQDKLRQQIKKLESSGRLICLDNLLLEHLVGKSYFIVLDGLWEKDQWEFLRTALPNQQGKGSRLLLTSRNRNIVGHEQVHEMKILDPNKSWQMFLKTVFTNDEKCPNQLEKIGRDILKKCNGLPLAIQVVGSQLAKKSQCKSVWEDFLESMDLSGISAVLELSYVKLPPKLKSCFRSLGLFKQGTTIKVDKLVQVWIAGGMISKGEGEKNHSNEEIGRRYLDGLISQYMVQEKDMTIDCRVKSFCMNDNLHRLSITKAEEEMRFEVLQKDGNYRASHKPRPHRAIYCTREKFNFSTNQDAYLRTLFFHGGGNFDASPSYWESLEQLKILFLEGFGLQCLPQKLGTVINLRYLGLRSNFIRKIPRSFGHLDKLEVLDISHNFMVEVADIIWRMESLCHLYMSDIICQRPLRIDALKHLQTLTYISAENWIYELSGLQKMKSLCKLGIEDLDETSDVIKLFTSLAKLKNLDCLILRGFRFRSMPSLDELGILTRLTKLKLDGLLTRLPREKNFPPNIAYLTLVNSSLVENPMPMLGKLTKLVYLKLRNAFTGEEMVISRRKFAKLQVLSIREFWHLRNLQVAEGAMPRLGQLEINSCPYLETLPHNIGLMTSLKELKMVTTKNIASKIRESGFISKMQHVNILIQP